MFHYPTTINYMYYKRQLFMFAFKIQLLSRKSIFYCHHERIAKKGSHEVASFFMHFMNTFLEDDGEELIIFPNSCGGQNKNYTIFRFINFPVIHQIFGLKKVMMTFPIPGHSYLESDKNVGLFNWKLGNAQKLSRYGQNRKNEFFAIIVNVKQEMVMNWSSFLNKLGKGYFNKWLSISRC